MRSQWTSVHLHEIGEVKVPKGTIWNIQEPPHHILLYCIKGNGILQLLNEQIPIAQEQFIIISRKEAFKYYAVQESNSHFLVAHFGGRGVKKISNHFFVVRNLIPSINNLVANREMLFDEIFQNLSMGFHDENLHYVNLCFGHLLGTFIYANRTSEDIADERSPAVRKAVQFLGKNLSKRISLNQLAEVTGYSPTYLTTLFKKEMNYSPISYFSHLKVLKACEFLDYSNMKIKEISYTLGYADPYYFTRDFKKKIGRSPRSYRNRASTRV